MPSKNRKFGDIGEKIAEKYLFSKGYKIIEKNYWKPWGEIDIVSAKDKTIVFIEVKTRDKINVSRFTPESSVNRDKIRKLSNICETYLEDRKYSIDQEWQIDVISVSIDKINKKARINHIENAIFGKEY